MKPRPLANEVGAWSSLLVPTETGSAEKKPRENAVKAWARALESLNVLQQNPNLTLPLLVKEAGLRHGEAAALIGEGEVLSYRGLADRARQYAGWAAARRLGPGDMVALLMHNCPDYPAIWLGITQTGAAVALLNSQLSQAALLNCIATAACGHLIVADDLVASIAELTERLPQSITIWVHGDGEDGGFARLQIDAAEQSSVATANYPKARDLALLIFTSGTTGMPKAAKITHGRVLEWSFWFAAMMDARSSDVLYNCLPLYHSTGGVVAIGAMLVSGGATVIRKRFSASRFWEDIVQNGCTIFQYIGELCRYLTLGAPDPREAEHQLRLCCGNGMRAEVWQVFQERFKIPRILEFYAATEGNISLYNCEGKPGAIGRVPPFLSHRFPIALVKCDITTGEVLRDGSGRCIACAIDEAGEAIGKIQASAESQFDGYTNPEATAAKLIRDVFTAGDQWFRTGDLMRKDRAGYYYFVDRLGESFRWKGENVSTAEVAEILSGCPGVKEIVVFGVAVPDNEGKAGMAAFTADADFLLDRLQDYIIRNLAAYARPVFLRSCEALETTGTFKTKKDRLQREGYRDIANRDAVWVFDNAGGSYVACGARELEWIAAGGIGHRPAVSGA